MQVRQAIDRLCWHPYPINRSGGFLFGMICNKGDCFPSKIWTNRSFIDESRAHRHAKSSIALLTNPVTIVVLTSTWNISALHCWSNFLSNGKSLALVLLLVILHAYCIAFCVLPSATTTSINSRMLVDPSILPVIQCVYIIIDERNRSSVVHTNTASIQQSSSSVG
jgi:hypothetical protein